MTKERYTEWKHELLLLPLLFTLAGICFTLTILTPMSPPPYYFTLNTLWLSLGAILFAFGIWLAFRLHTCLHALSTNTPPDYQSLNHTFRTLFIILLLCLLFLVISNSFYWI